MLKKSKATYSRIYRVTSQSFKENNSIISYKGNDIYAKTTKGTYRVFQDSKLFREISKLTKALEDVRIL